MNVQRAQNEQHIEALNNTNNNMNLSLAPSSLGATQSFTDTDITQRTDASEMKTKCK